MKGYISLLLLFTLLHHPSAAQQVGQKHFPLLEDNRAVNINCIFKSATGFIYVGTNTGLFKFDGENFSKLYFKNRDYSDTVTAITEDNNRIIWAGFKSGRLAKLVNGRLSFINPEEGNPAARISSMSFDAGNNIWYAAYGEGLYYMKNNRHYLLNAENGFTDLNINAICKAGNTEMLAATDQGFAICTAGSKKIQLITPANGLPDYMITNIKAAGNYLFWIALQDKGFCLYDHNSKKIISIPAAANWPYGQINDLLPEGNNLWIATKSSGLVCYDMTEKTLSVKKDVNFPDIHQLVKDAQGNLWFSGHENNLVRSYGNALTLQPFYKEDFFEKIHAILFDQEENTWINDDMALIKFSVNDGTVRSQRIPIPALDMNTDITALYQDKFQYIWIGTMGKGIFLLDPRSNRIRHLPEPFAGNASILSISGKGDSVFTCSLQGATLTVLTAENKNIQGRYHFTSFDYINTGSHYIYNIFKDSRNRLWFASDGNGLSVQDTHGSVTHFSENQGIKDGHVYSVTEDRNGHIWFSTASDGVYRYDGKKFTNYGLREGLSDLYISVVKTLGSGYIAVVNKKGIDIINPATGQIAYLNSNHGIGQVNADNLGAVATDNKSRLLVTSNKGILSYDLPAEICLQPVTILESVQLFLKDVDTAQKAFSYTDNNFTFNFIGLYYSDPAAVYYQYKLEGLDSNWISTRDRSLSFPGLAPGKYVFKVRSSLNKNFANAQEASYGFVIRPAFYKTWYFIGTCILLLATLLYLYIRSREQQIKKMQQLQNEKNLFRFEVLRNQVNPHFLFNSFNTLISTIEENPKMAVEYAEQLSDFFRNIVNYRDKDTILLSEELELLQTYYFLQQKRYGSHLVLNTHIPEAAKKKYVIPPLSLQLLLENAIKHNAVSKDSKLEVNIQLENNNMLVISNKKNKRTVMETGAGMGLQNIRNRFKLLTGRHVVIFNTDDIFTVHLPIIPND